VLPPLLLLLAALIVLYRDTAESMVTIWSRSDTFAHAFLVPPIVAWLLWRRRDRLAAVSPRPVGWVLLLMAGVSFLWLLGELAAANSVTQLAFTALLVLSVPAVAGFAATRAMLFPLAFLFFAVPIGEFLLPQLMEWTADFTVFALRLSGVPVYREGLRFVIPSGTWSVVEACSGVRYLLASGMVGTLFAYLNFRSMRRRIAFVAISFAIPIVANWVRAYLIVLLGHLSNNRIATGVDHLIYGWIFFGAIIMLMFMVGRHFADSDMPSGPKAASTVGLQRPASLPRSPLARGRAWMTASVGLSLLALPQLAVHALNANEDVRLVSLGAPTTLADGWKLSDQPVAEWKPAFQNPSAEINRTYIDDGRSVGLYIGYYRGQSAERKLVSSDNAVVRSGDAQWTQVSVGSKVVVVDQHPIAVRTVHLHQAQPGAALAAADTLLVWQTYWVNGRFTASDPWAKAYMSFDKLLGRGDDSAVLVFYASGRSSGGAQEATLQSFLRANLRGIEALLSDVRNRDRQRASNPS
jgi:exosortase A